MSGWLTVIAPGPYATVQDLGRPGHGRWGVSPGGAADRASFRLANRLVGNPPSAAAVELTLGDAAFTFGAGAFVAVTGAPLTLSVDGRAGNIHAPQWVPAGAELTFGRPATGLRSYLAVRGGIETPTMLGSRSVDPPSGFGSALVAGDQLPLGEPASDLPGVHVAPVGSLAGVAELAAVPGPRSSWCDPGLSGREWIVGADSDRVGVRLLGEPLRRRGFGELASEPAIRGAVELPPDGQPIVFLADHPTTCGYPIIAVLDDAAADRCAQLRPGDRARLHVVAQ